jgi:exosortase
MQRDGLKIAAVVCVASFAALYWNILDRLIQDWTNDDNYSHGFFIIPLAAYFLWERRTQIAAVTLRPNALGLVTVAGGLLVLLAGLLGAELFLTRVSMLIVLTGVVLFVGGWALLRAVAFPLMFLVLMIPIPAIIFNQIAFPLQLFASRLGEWAISIAGIPVLREGNVLILANTTLEVAEACSGIRSLVSLITLAIVYGYFIDPRTWVRLLIVASAVPVAIVANGARVATTGMSAQWIGQESTEGFFHDFSGWLVFIFAFAMILLVQFVIARFAPKPAASSAAPAGAGK